nr:MAG TPA: RapA N-terminal Tudor like domain [Bacteriophage sp.]
MTISHELRQLSVAIQYLNRKRNDLLDDLKAHPEKHGCPYHMGQEFKTRDGAVYKVEAINVLTYPSADGIYTYYQAQAVNQNKPHDRKEYTVQIK